MPPSTALVLGLGRSGRAAARLIDRLGGASYVVDDGAASPEGLPDSARVTAAAEAAGALGSVDFVVASPGVAASHPLLRAALAAQVPIYSEPELAFRHLQAPLVAITGTNGKSTTVELTAAMLAQSGAEVFVGGNLGVPLCEAVGRRWDYVVAEISSFQLEWVETFKPAVGALLNLSADHLDRHGDMESYFAAKLRLFANMDASGFAVLGRDEDWFAGAAAAIGAWVGQDRVSSFGIGPAPADVCGTTADLRARRLYAAGGFEVALAPAWPLAPHDFRNAAAAAEIARVLGVSSVAIAAAIAAFKPLAHRLRKVRSVAGVSYWNDSKATNVGAVLSVLDAFEGGVILMLGGVAKNRGFEALAAAREKIKLVVAYGRAGAEVEAALSSQLPLLRCAGFEDAFEAARSRAAAGDSVLLAPACASFDEFADFEARGRHFERLVDTLADADVEV